MAGFFSRVATKRVFGGVAAGGVGLGTAQYQSNKKQASICEECVAEFNKSYGYKGKIVLPEGWVGFQIKNDYPLPEDIPKWPAKNTEQSVSQTSKSDGIIPWPRPGGPDKGVPSFNPRDDAPWLDVDFRTDPHTYCKVIKEYCWAGNTNTNFKVHDNPIRPWYHAPWMHWNDNGREPISGLTFERPTDPQELSKDQKRLTQAWAIGFYNWMGATVFGEMWQDPANPKWDKHVVFPLGTCVFKVLMTEATEQEVPCLKGAPTFNAAIATAESAAKRPNGKSGSAAVRKKEPEPLRLLQVDFAVRDDRVKVGPDGNGWVFGTFMYDGNRKDADPWNRIIPVGLMWGNDPKLTPELAEKGEKPQQSWINKEATDLLNSMGGDRALHGWGVGGRLNGPVDNFKSACASCHSTAEYNLTDTTDMLPPKGADTNTFMRWYRNIGPGESFSGGTNWSADYSLQLQRGFFNYRTWRNKADGWTHEVKKAFSPTLRLEAKILEQKTNTIRGMTEDEVEKKK